MPSCHLFEANCHNTRRPTHRGLSLILHSAGTSILKLTDVLALDALSSPIIPHDLQNDDHPPVSVLANGNYEVAITEEWSHLGNWRIKVRGAVHDLQVDETRVSRNGGLKERVVMT